MVSRILLARCAFRSCTALCFLPAAIVWELHGEVSVNEVVRIPVIGRIEREARFVCPDLLTNANKIQNFFHP